jgi:HAD superfamily hydrolase (TIGR01509 family)
MNPARPRYLLLDIGMVLVGLDYAPLADRMHSLAGIEPAKLETVLTAEDLVQKYETGKITESDFYNEVCRRIGIRIPWPEFLQAWYSVFAQPLISDELLAALARNVHLWALSNTNKLHFEFMTRQYTFLRHFEGFVLSHEVGALKPDARIFLHALEKTQARASDVLFVDDQESNVRAAQALGIEAFRFLSPDQFAAEMKARGLL